MYKLYIGYIYLFISSKFFYFVKIIPFCVIDLLDYAHDNNPALYSFYHFIINAIF